MGKQKTPIRHRDFRVTSGDMKIIPDLLGLHAIQSFIIHNSSPRGLMLASQLGQILTIEGGEEKIIITGTESELGKYTTSVKMANDSKVLAMITRYGEMPGVGDEVNFMLIYEDLKTGLVDSVEVPYKHQSHPYFGYKYVRDLKYLRSLRHGTIIPAGTYLAKSPTVRPYDGSAIGVNLNIANVSINEVAEDALIISESTAKRFSFKMYEKVVAESGPTGYFKNVYGDENTFKAFPGIGEYLKPNGMFCAIAEHDPYLSPAMVSRKSMLDIVPSFDKCVFVKPGRCKVVDLKIHKNPKFKQDAYTGTTDTLEKYANSLNTYHRNVVNAYDAINSDYKSRYGTRNDLIVDDNFTNEIVYAKAMIDSTDTRSERKIKKISRKEALDIFRVEATIEIEINTLTAKHKLSDLSGGKGVVIKVLPDHLMPYDPVTGIRADIMGDPASPGSRMNIGRLYEPELGAGSRRCQTLLREAVEAVPNPDKVRLKDFLPTLPDSVIDPIFDIVLRFYKIVSHKNYTVFSKANRELKLETILHSYLEEVQVVVTVDHETVAYQLVEDIKASEFAPAKNTIMVPEFRADGSIKMVRTKEKVSIGPLYFILLNKIADDALATSSARINHFGIPISVSKVNKHELPWRDSPVKFISETEGRVFVAYTSELAMAEIIDRANNVNAHKAAYKCVLEAPVPTNIDRVIDRKKIPFGGSKALEIGNTVLNSSGVELAYKSGAEKRSCGCQ